MFYIKSGHRTKNSLTLVVANSFFSYENHGCLRTMKMPPPLQILTIHLHINIPHERMNVTKNQEKCNVIHKMISMVNY